MKSKKICNKNIFDPRNFCPKNLVKKTNPNNSRKKKMQKNFGPKLLSQKTFG